MNIHILKKIRKEKSRLIRKHSTRNKRGNQSRFLSDLYDKRNKLTDEINNRKKERDKKR